MTLPSIRVLNGLAALISVGLIVFAILYLQNVLGLPPCPLCIFQRVAFMAVALVFLVAAVHGPGVRGLRVYGGLGLLVALTGAGIAARHLWLQAGPGGGIPSCGPGLTFMLDNYALPEVIHTVFRGSGDCGDQHWTWLGLSIPGWALLSFLGYAVFAGWQVVRGGQFDRYRLNE